MIINKKVYLCRAKYRLIQRIKSTITLIIGFFIICISSTVLSDAEIDGREMKYLINGSNSPTYLGRGYTGVSGYFENSIQINPAAMGFEISPVFYGNYGSVQYPLSLICPAAGIVYPLEKGTVGVEYAALNPGVRNSYSAHVLRGAYAMQLFPDVYAGLGLTTILLYTDEETPHVILMPVFGMLIPLNFDYFFTEEIGIIEPMIGGSLMPEFNVSSNNDLVNLSTVSFGGNFIFFRLRNYAARYFSEMTVMTDYLQIPFKQGVEFEISKKYRLRAGVIVPDAYQNGGITCGAGINYRLSSLKGKLDYALVHRNKREYSHYIGISAMYSNDIYRESELSVHTHYISFSPNADGKKDEQIFEIPVFRNTEEIKISILDSKDRLVLSQVAYQSGSAFPGVRDDRLYWRWDGRNADGVTVEGTYHSQIDVITRNSRALRVNGGYFTIDNEVPSAKVQFENVLFSGQDDPVIIRHEMVTKSDTDWNAEIVDSVGTVVKNWQWPSGVLPRIVRWSGEKNLKDGAYYYRLKNEDLAGNVYESISGPFLLVASSKEKVFTDKKQYNASDKYISFFSTLIPEESRGAKLSVSSKGQEKEYSMEDTILKIERDKFQDGRYLYSLKQASSEESGSGGSFSVDTKPPTLIYNVMEYSAKEGIGTFTVNTVFDENLSTLNADLKAAELLIARSCSFDKNTISLSFPLAGLTRDRQLTLRLSVRDVSGNETVHDFNCIVNPMLIREHWIRIDGISRTAGEIHKSLRERLSPGFKRITVLYSDDAIIADLRSELNGDVNVECRFEKSDTITDNTLSIIADY